jgi:ribosomal protein L21
VYTGLRPGEKMYEELQLECEETVAVSDDLFKVQGHIQIGEAFMESIAKLGELVREGKAEAAKNLIFLLLEEFNNPPRNSALRIPTIQSEVESEILNKKILMFNETKQLPITSSNLL